VAKTCRGGVKSTMYKYTVVNDEPPWIDWKMPHIIGGLHVGSGGRGPFADPRPPDQTCTPQVNVRVSRRILCFQRRKFKKSEYIVHLFEFLR